MAASISAAPDRGTRQRSDPSAGRISVDSPVGRALVGHKKGDKVTVSVPSGTLTLTIKAVK